MVKTRILPTMAPYFPFCLINMIFTTFQNSAE
nr:MAG TPA: hypothetical protein [Caudoviricetes sp.]